MLDGRELRVQMARYGRPTSPQRRFRGRRRYKSVKSLLTAIFIKHVVGLVHVLDILVLTLGPEEGGAGLGPAVADHTAEAILVQIVRVLGADQDQHQEKRIIQNPSPIANLDQGLGLR